ncbi:TPA: hypothetical protein ACIX42_005643, partial [Escherichia coli]|uniref:hypothetical protein n=5 Tax=Enterobacteriaceae TaxID=543 RepID=UPI001BC85A04
VEQGIENPRVGGSIPPPGTTLHQSHWSGVRTLTGVIGKVQDVVSLGHAISFSRLGSMLVACSLSRSFIMIATVFHVVNNCKQSPD